MHGPRDILCFSSSDWCGRWGSRQQVMSRLAARGHRVLFVEQMAGLEHFYRYADLRTRRVRRWREGRREIQPRLWLAAPPPLLPGRYYSRSIAAWNARLVIRWLEPHLHDLAFESALVWTYKPEHAALLPLLGDAPVVYHCIDEFTVGTRGRKRRLILELEHALLRRADLVFANSALTCETKRTLNARTVRVSSGADVNHFARAADVSQPVSPDVAPLPRPVLAYVGTINEKVDVSVLDDVAVRRPDWTILLVGELYGHPGGFRRLRTRPNVTWLGKRPFSDLPAILRGVDLCLLPYVEDTRTMYRSPLKLYEYLASGRPIVSTPHPEVDQFAGVVDVVSPGQFVAGIERRLAVDTPQDARRRLRIACEHSWDARVDLMCEHLTRLQPRAPGVGDPDRARPGRNVPQPPGASIR